jgi:hypothetical protein
MAACLPANSAANTAANTTANVTAKQAANQTTNSSQPWKVKDEYCSQLKKMKLSTKKAI